VCHGRQAIEEAAEPLETRGIVVAERGRFRVRERTVLRYYARTIEHLLVTPAGRTDARQRVEDFLPPHRSKPHPQELARATACGSRPASRAASSPARRREAIEAARIVEARGLLITLDLLGESVTKLDEADGATRGYLRSIDAIDRVGHRAQHLAEADAARPRRRQASAVDNLRKIPRTRRARGFFVRIDMENSPYTERDARDLRDAVAARHRQIGVVLQSALYAANRICSASTRSARACGSSRAPTRSRRRRVPEEGGRRRRVRADDEDADHRRPLSGDRDARPEMIDAARDCARDTRRRADRFEFQMLYGVRRDLQAMLVKAGTACASTFRSARMVSLLHAPARASGPRNVTFVLRSILGNLGNSSST
jgi:proline dehydrogenase